MLSPYYREPEAPFTLMRQCSRPSLPPGTAAKEHSLDILQREKTGVSVEPHDQKRWVLEEYKPEARAVVWPLWAAGREV